MKLEDKHPILKLIPSNRKISKEVLSKVLGKKERTIRREIQRAREDVAIISTSDKKGYRKVGDISTMTIEQLKDEAREVEHSRNEFVKRQRELDPTINTFTKQLLAINHEINKRKSPVLRTLNLIKNLKK